MKELEKIDDMLYKANYVNHDSKQVLEIWSKIKNNKPLLEWAIKQTKDKFGDRDLVNGLAICNSMLVYYDSVDKDIYNELIKLIYSNEEIARIVIAGASNGGYSFLLMSLWNHELELTDEQKKFAEKEAMFKIGTKFWNKQQKAYSQKLDEMGISDDNTTLIDIDGSINPIGQKTNLQYMKYIFSSICDNQAHGTGDYDIRYHILSNPNWTIAEKQKLVYDFWEDNEEYDEILDQWEWGILNRMFNYLDCTSSIEKDYLYYYQYNDLLNIFNNEEIAKTLWNDIQFCKLMHQLRPQQWKIIKKETKRLKKYQTSKI